MFRDGSGIFVRRVVLAVNITLGAMIWSRGYGSAVALAFARLSGTTSIFALPPFTSLIIARRGAVFRVRAAPDGRGGPDRRGRRAQFGNPAFAAGRDEQRRRGRSEQQAGNDDG